VEGAIRPSTRLPRTALICMENTHNAKGGTVVRHEEMLDVIDVARKYNIPVHLDGARVFNAAFAQNIDVKELVAEVDSVMFCLSKGLSAPIGSMLAGSTEFIEKARRMRTMVGGGMRQVGVIASAGIVALTEMTERLAEDHKNARILAEGLVEIPGIRLDMETVQTNFALIFIDTHRISPQEFVAAMKKEEILVTCAPNGRCRLVTHYGITEEDVEKVIEGISKIMKN
ncbi:MAG: aminotransferase class I/II-fold pyridoxal phosphate-dependent enzyme, partial [Candidatus Tectomicrobia bacterium]|nr:aminotransferase class I/II-fold pyridoxal phosphate-dependent enzyme [Candidatus Tectomicrobia bacterium]